MRQLAAIARRLRSFRGYNVGAACALVLSLASSTWLVLRYGSPTTGEPRDLFSDHLRHVLESWTFLFKGFGIYRGTFGETALTNYPHFDVATVGVPWPTMPVTYPMGTFAFFLPPTLVGAYVPMSRAAFTKVIVIYVVVMTHLAILGVVRCLRGASAGRTVVLVAVWLLMIKMCMHGFYDGVWLGLGAMSIAKLADQRPGASLQWFAGAAFTSLKAVSLAPVGAWALFLLLRSNARLRTKLALATPAALVCIHAFWAVVVTFRYIPKPGTPTYDAAKSILLPIGTAGEIVIAAGLVAALLAAFNSNWLVAISVALATAVTIHHAGHSWHAAVLVPSALLPGALPSDRRIGLTREIAALWMLGVSQIAYLTPLYAVVEYVIERVG